MAEAKKVKLDPIFRIKMPMHPRTSHPRKLRFKVFKQFGKTFKHGIWGRGKAILVTRSWQATLHEQTGTPTRPPFNRFGKDAVNLTGVRFGTL